VAQVGFLPHKGFDPRSASEDTEAVSQMTEAQQAKAAHEDALMSLPHVVGVGTGRNDETSTDIVIVWVDRKVPLSELNDEEVIPQSIDGVPIRVEAIGQPEAQGL
jgi:hypothetical protein